MLRTRSYRPLMDWARKCEETKKERKDRAEGYEEGSSAKCFPHCRVLLTISCIAQWIDGLHDTHRLSNHEADDQRDGVVGHENRRKRV